MKTLLEMIQNPGTWMLVIAILVFSLCEYIKRT